MPSAPTFPLSIIANHRHLVDAKNQPFFYQADTPWFLRLQLTLPETREGFDDRKAKGFPARHIVEILESALSQSAPGAAISSSSA